MDYSLVTDMFWKWQWDELRKTIGVKSGDNNSQNKQKE
jgi:hypothetical protein